MAQRYNRANISFVRINWQKFFIGDATQAMYRNTSSTVSNSSNSTFIKFHEFGKL